MNIPEKLMERYGKSHLSYSSLKQALGDMAQFDRYMKGELKYKSDALSFGTLYDMLLFERDLAMDKYVIVSQDKIIADCSDKTKDSKRPTLTKEYKEAKEKVELEYAEQGKVICAPDDWKMANDMIDRLDACGGNGFISDSKSTKSVEKFRYSVRDFSYDIQAYIYTKVFNIKDFYWVAQEKTYPYLPALIKCTDETLFVGGMKFTNAVTRIEDFLDRDYNPVTDYLQYEV